MKLRIGMIVLVLTMPLAGMGGEKHVQNKQKFKYLREQAGIKTEHGHMHRMHPHRGAHQHHHAHRHGMHGHHHGRPVNQAQMDAARQELNTLLEKSPLTGSDIQTIKEKINAFKALKPIRWPKPEQYEELLAKKIARQGSEQQELKKEERQPVQLEQQKKAQQQVSAPSQIAKTYKKRPLTLKEAIKQGDTTQAQQLMSKGQKLTDAEIDELALNANYAHTLVALGLIPPPPSE